MTKVHRRLGFQNLQVPQQQCRYVYIIKAKIECKLGNETLVHLKKLCGIKRKEYLLQVYIKYFQK